MEAIGIVGSVAVALSFSRAYITTVRQLTEPDDVRLLSLQAKLLSENGRLTKWVEYMNVRTWEDIERQLRPDDREQVKLLWISIVDMLEKAKRYIDRLDLTKGKFVQRLRWIVGGEYQRLKDLLEAIRDVNNALYTVAQPPPRYTPTIEPEQRLWGSPLRQITNNQGTPSARETTNENIQEEDEPEPPQTRREIFLLSRLAATTLRNILGHVDEDNALKICFTRLQKWPGTFLEGELALDLLLNKKEKGVTIYDALKEALITTFVDILLVEEVLLKHMIKHADTRDLERSLIAITSTFFHEDIIDTACCRSASVSETDPQTMLFTRSAYVIDVALDDLDDLLPTIRSIRHGHLLDVESKALSSSNPEASASNSAPTIHDVVQELDSILDSTGESVDDALARIMRKEREIMADSEQYFAGIKLRKDQQDKIDTILRGLQKGVDTEAVSSTGVDLVDLDETTWTEYAAAIKDPDKKQTFFKGFGKRIHEANEGFLELRRDIS